VLFNAGNQVPVIAGLLVDDSGNASIVAPEQKGPTGVKVGVTGSFIVTEMVLVAVQVLPSETVTV